MAIERVDGEGSQSDRVIRDTLRDTTGSFVIHTFNLGAIRITLFEPDRPPIYIYETNLYWNPQDKDEHAAAQMRYRLGVGLEPGCTIWSRKVEGTIQAKKEHDLLVNVARLLDDGTVPTGDLSSIVNRFEAVRYRLVRRLELDDISGGRSRPGIRFSGGCLSPIPNDQAARVGTRRPVWVGAPSGWAAWHPDARRRPKR